MASRGTRRIAGRVAKVALAGVSLLACATALHAQAVNAQPAAATSGVVNVSVPAGSLESGLLSLGRQTNLRMLYPSNLTSGKRTGGVSGQLTPQQAVTQLLAGTGLRAAFTSANNVQIFDPTASAAGAGPVPAGTTLLDPIYVQGAGNPNSTMTPMPAYAGGQVATGGQLGMLGNRSVMDTPFNQTSFTAKKAQDQQAKTVRDVLVDDPSVRSFVPDNGSGADQVYIRGFPVQNGSMAYGGLYGMLPQVSVMSELAERIELLKGPSVLLYGMPPATSIGGTINIVPKRAPAEPLNQITANYASAGQVGGHVDVARRFGDQQQFGVRFNGVYKDGETGIQWNTDKRALAVLGMDLRSETVRMSIDLGYQHQHVDGMIPYLGFANNVPVLRPPDASRNVGQPWNYSNYEDVFGVVRTEVDLTDRITAYVAFGAHHGRGMQVNAGTRVTANDIFGNATSRPLSFNNSGHYRTAETGVRAQADTGPIHHELAITATTYSAEIAEASIQLGTVNTNIYNPVLIPKPYLPVPRAVKTSTQNLSSVGIADTLSVFDKRIQLTVGGRLQQVQAANFNTTTGAQTSSYDQSAFSPAVALVVKPLENVSLYGNYIQGLQQGIIVPAGFANAGEVFPPYVSTQYETGVKVDWGRFTTTVSLFQISQPSILTDVPANRRVLGGEQRNRGVELNVFGEVTPGIRALGGVMFLEGVLTKTQGGLTDGWIAPHAPIFSLNLGGELDVPFIRGLTLTGRAIHTAAQYIDTTTPRRQLPEWTRYDLGARYTFENPAVPGKNVTARFSVENVLDTDYWAGGSGAITLMLGAPRTYRLSLTTDF
jgi:iron complex outermembrane recepter protein